MKRLMVVPQQLPVEGGGGEEAPVLLGVPDDILEAGFWYQLS